MIVLDTSVAIKWYNKEEGTDKALDIQNAHVQNRLKINFPDLILYELANAIRYSPANDIEELKSILDNFNRLKFNIIIPTITMIKDAGELAFRCNITVYDTTYLTLAQHLNCEFVTADERLLKKIRDDLPFVKLLYDL